MSRIPSMGTALLAHVSRGCCVVVAYDANNRQFGAKPAAGMALWAEITEKSDIKFD